MGGSYSILLLIKCLGLSAIKSSIDQIHQLTKLAQPQILSSFTTQLCATQTNTIPYYHNSKILGHFTDILTPSLSSLSHHNHNHNHNHIHYHLLIPIPIEAFVKLRSIIYVFTPSLFILLLLIEPQSYPSIIIIFFLIVIKLIRKDRAQQSRGKNEIISAALVTYLVVYKTKYFIKLRKHYQTWMGSS
jgi:hypothetical protein